MILCFLGFRDGLRAWAQALGLNVGTYAVPAIMDAVAGQAEAVSNTAVIAISAQAG